MVKELGQYFEEFVKDYLRLVKGIDLVEMEYPYTTYKKDYKKRKSARSYPADIDVIGLKSNEIWIVECKEHIGRSAKEVKRMKNKFKKIKSLTDEKFHGKHIRRFIAYYSKGKKVSEEDFKDEEFLPQLEFLDFKSMFIELIKKTKDQENIATLGRYHWFLEKLRREKFEDKDKNILLNFFNLNKSK